MATHQRPWGAESIRTILGFGDQSTPKPLRSHTPEKLLRFQAILEDLASDHHNFSAPDAEQGAVVLDFGRPADRAAAAEITQRVRGVSKWKPSLVPRVLGEKEFYENFFGRVRCAAADYFSDDRNLEDFLADADGDAPPSIEMSNLSVAPPAQEQQQEQQTAEQERLPEAQGAAKADEHAVAQAEDGTAGSGAAGLPRFSEANCPQGARASAALLEGFLGKHALFFVGKSENANAVVYEAKLAAPGVLAAQDPVQVYWVLYARDPVVEEGLTLLERNTAYGSTCAPMAGKPGRFEMALSALKDRKIEVWADQDNTLHAVTRINGEPDELLSVFVQSTSNWVGLPKVEYIDLTGANRTERLYNR